MKSQVLHTVWCHISCEAAGEFWHWSLSGGLNWSHIVLIFVFSKRFQRPVLPFSQTKLTLVGIDVDRLNISSCLVHSPRVVLADSLSVSCPRPSSWITTRKKYVTSVHVEFLQVCAQNVLSQAKWHNQLMSSQFSCSPPKSVTYCTICVSFHLAKMQCRQS